MPVGSDPDGLRLQKVLRDLVALSAVPSVWVGRESRDIAADLADLLATLLNLDFAFVHLRDSDGSAAGEMARGTTPPAVLELVEQYRDGRRRLSRPEIVPGAGAGNAAQGAGIVFPLGVNAEIGLVAAASDRADFPSEIDQLLLSVAACHGATAFRMARLLEKHQRSETALAVSEQQLRQVRDELEMKVAERTAELRRSEAYLAEAERLSHTGTWAVNLKDEGTIVYASEESYRLYGFDPLQGLPTRDAVRQRVHPDDRSRVYGEIQEALGQKRDYVTEFRMVLPDGTIRYVQEIGHHVFSARGEPLEVLGINVDVTETKRAKESLRESEAKFRDYAESASDWFWETGPDYKFTVLTENAFGANGAARIGTACWDHALDLETEPEKWRLVRETLEARKPFRDFVYCTRGGNGSPMYVKAAGKPVFYANGEFRGYRGTGTDVTATMRAQEELQRSVQELQRSEFYLAEGQRLGHTGSWAFNPSGFFEYWSRELFQIQGLDPQKGAPTLEQFLAAIHPQDRDFMAETVKRMCEQGSGCDVKKRIIRADGAVRYIRFVGIPVLDNGVLKLFLGTAMDVTEQEQLTQELQRREAYLAGAQKLSHTGSFGWKPDSGEIVWSDETYRIFEYDPAVKPTIDSVVHRVHPQDRLDLQKVIADASRGATDFEHTYRLLLPDGRVKHVHALAHASQDACGNREFVGAVTDITERKTAEEALRTSEAYLAEAQRLSHTGSWAWSPDTDDRYWSRECYCVLGFDPRDGVPRMEELIQRIHPDDQAAFRESANRAKHKRSDEEVDYRIVHPDGAVRDIHSIGHPVFSPSGDLVQFMGTVIDITERKRAEESLRKNEAYLAEAQRLSQTGSWAWSPDQDIRYWSDECYRVLSFDPQDGLPRFEDFFQRIHPDDQPGFRELIETAIREKAEWEADYRIVHPDGPVRDIHALGHPVLSTSGHLIEFVGTVIDVTERRRAEQERARLRQLEADLAHINRVSTLGEMAASLAHEVKQPIAAARNNARAALNFLAKKPSDLGEVREALGCIVGDADRAGDIIDRIRAHTKKAPLRKDRFDLNEAVTEVVELARSAITKHGVSLETRLAEELFAVQGDRVQLQQVILNLILNAIEAMSSVDGPRELVISTEQRQTNGLVSVRDSGPGVDPEQRERVFEAFYTTKSNGVGIGLSICRSIIDAHGGRLWIEVNEPRGAIFQFTVPSAASELRGFPQAPRRTREPHADTGRDAAHQGVSAGNTRPPHLARGPRRRHRGRTS
jgi:PAS domain S-box-containing protein